MSKGIVDAQTELGKPIPMGAFNVQSETEKVIAQTNSLLERLMSDMSGLFDKAIRENSETDRVANVIGAFNSNEYRLSFIANTELYRAYNYGKATAAKTAGLTTVEVTSGDKCDKCVEKKGQPFVLTEDSLLEKVPPFHPNCTCVVTLHNPDKEV
jgi:SPP1 gp7 family putative phage head morphogenesis protein